MMMKSLWFKLLCLSFSTFQPASTTPLDGSGGFPVKRGHLKYFADGDVNHKLRNL